MVLPSDPRYQFETKRLCEAIAQSVSTVICLYPDENLIGNANRQIRELLGPIVKDIQRHTLTLENGTVIRLVHDRLEESETRGRTNYFIIR